jgi:hypothetical protein
MANCARFRIHGLTGIADRIRGEVLVQGWDAENNARRTETGPQFYALRAGWTLPGGAACGDIITRAAH